MMTMDDNFDGKISYQELKNYIDSLGFDIKSLEDTN
jgi:Ca2+-binding EF-hand superfamily protein